ncbi:MAG TPA: ABC transporter ATP-binding protein [Nocardioides sp.]|nr:ABC transporter ATP-binding protein [Nocardioides sp.]
MTTPMSGLEVDVTVPGRVTVALTAEPGEVLAVIGPNGAGKTSLLGAVAGLVPAEGTVRLNGRDLGPLPVRQRGVGVVFQDKLLFPHLSALENVAFGPRSRGVPRAEARATAREWLDRLAIGELAGRRPKELSGGQAQRVAIARALAQRPDVMLLDEPFAGLDISVAAALRIELTRHLASYDGITLLVTHDAIDALTLADRVVVIDDGAVAQVGTPGEVSARPRTEHVARLVGLNVIRDGDAFRCFAPGAVTVSLARPEGSARNVWSGTVLSAAPHGDAIRLLVAAGPELIADVTPAATRELGLEPGREVWLSVKETAVDIYAVSPEGTDKVRP